MIPIYDSKKLGGKDPRTFREVSEEREGSLGKSKVAIRVNKWKIGRMEGREGKGGIGKSRISQEKSGGGRIFSHSEGIDEVAIFNVALSADDIKAIAKSGLAVALGMTAVSPTGKIAATWGSIKEQ